MNRGRGGVEERGKSRGEEELRGQKRRIGV